MNTKPDPWVIEFTQKKIDITVGTDITGHVQSDFDSVSINDIRSRDANNPLIISYNDGGSPVVQSGTLKIFWENDNIVLSLSDVSFTGYPRTCSKGTLSGIQCVPPIADAYVCDNEVIEIRNRNTYTTFTCPTCLRNIACGLMGKYTRGDCSDSDLANSNSACYNILQGSQKNIYTPPNNDNSFRSFADTWSKTFIDGLSVKPNFYKNRDYSTPNVHNFKPKPLSLEGRRLDIVDTNYFDGECNGNLDKIKSVNETCRLNTVVKYEACCKEIGRICEVMWSACIEDMCSCADPTVDEPWTDDDCLNIIVHDSMNETCSIDRFFPTATPTNAPTPSPVGLIPGIPKGKKAEDLIWLYLIFVILFVVIAGAAYWYYRKKNVGKVVMDDEEMDMQTVTIPSSNAGATYTQD